jgi:hypothetical protein
MAYEYKGRWGAPIMWDAAKSGSCLSHAEIRSIQSGLQSTSSFYEQKKASTSGGRREGGGFISTGDHLYFAFPMMLVG